MGSYSTEYRDSYWWYQEPYLKDGSEREEKVEETAPLTCYHRQSFFKKPTPKRRKAKEAQAEAAAAAADFRRTMLTSAATKQPIKARVIYHPPGETLQHVPESELFANSQCSGSTSSVSSSKN